MPVDLSSSYHDQYQQALHRAEQAKDRGDIRTAALSYRQAAAYLVKYLGYLTGGAQQQALHNRVAELRERAAQLDRGELSQPPARPARASNKPPENEDGLQGKIIALIQKTEVAWHDIAGLEDTKREIKTAYALVMARKPQGVRVRAPSTLLLYGPPGTGKTLLAAATSNGLDATFFSVKVSDMLSKYFGESTRLVSALYAEARVRAPSVVFMDEFDALSRARGSGGSDSGPERRLLATFLAELDGLSTKGDAGFTLTIAATNRPWDLDSAIRSRFAREVYVPLPDDAARRRILQLHLQEKGHRLDVDFDNLVHRATGYSGRELSQLCETAVAAMIGRANPDLAALVDRGRQAVADFELHVQPLNREDFDAAFAAIGKPQTSPAELALYARWRGEREGG